jgi:protein TonB
MHTCLRWITVGLILSLPCLPAGAAANPALGRGLVNLFNYGDTDVKPVPVECVAPVYSPELRAAGAKGRVVVEFIMGLQGEVLAAQIVSSDDSRLNEACLTAVKTWKFTPAQKRGKVVNCRASQMLEFGLENNAAHRSADQSSGIPFQVSGFVELPTITLKAGSSSYPAEYYSLKNPLFPLDVVEVAPVSLSQPPPEITPELKDRIVRNRIRVVVEFVISKTGDTEFPMVQSSTDSRYNDICLAAVKQWKFKPALKKDKPVNCRVAQALILY